MEHLIRAFTRVIRRIDDADSIMALVSRIEKDDDFNASSVSAQDRRRILDFPDPEDEAANIAAASSLSKPDLLERAVRAPEQLSAQEATLLKDRYWDKVSRKETRARIAANEALSAVSDSDWHQTTDQLKALRAPLYEANEEKAIENAEAQVLKSLLAAAAPPKPAEAATPQRAPQWVNKFQENEGGQKPWGYAVFTDPEMGLGRERMEDYLARRDAALHWAMHAIGCGSAMEANWKTDQLDWPLDAKGDLPRVVKIQKLREHFLSLRDNGPPKRQRTGGSSDKVDSGGLKEGMLRNSILMIDRDCVDSVPSNGGPVDDMWVWVIDPDHHMDASKVSSEDDETTDASKHKYEGFLKVRLQQTVNNFFEARVFQEDIYSMQQLWGSAQMSRNRAFVSMKEEERQLWVPNRDVGSALRR
ncbi:hypothetical protein S40293_11317 [Stachybotrys chartarum IBT 40293]|nr:hypothetical protein S40293_11317 [Stachybotrys chartarum IBT 40293]